MQDKRDYQYRINKLALALREFRLAMFDVDLHEGERELIAVIADLAEAIEVAEQDIKYIRKRHMVETMTRKHTGDKNERLFTTIEDEWLVGDGFTPSSIGKAD